MSQPTGRRRRFHQAEPAVPVEIQTAVAEAVQAVAPIRKDKALPLLQAIQARLGHLPDSALAHASRVTRIPLADLNALVSFYELLTTANEGERVVHLCDDIVCRSAAGADELAAQLTAAGCAVRFAPCLGQCEKAPVALETGPVGEAGTAEAETGAGATETGAGSAGTGVAPLPTAASEAGRSTPAAHPARAGPTPTSPSSSTGAGATTPPT